ncbi:formate dehydrogenase accessory sulfurtransferase FdhD [Roseomonas sp. BN140053]|uniref:formate dehydrogenase accessory sulfurtransferase FdhD n=1 Tax=Roseomonas sp. BN140053 TaxID=3391898 RepID=UPI0039ECD652
MPPSEGARPVAATLMPFDGAPGPAERAVAVEAPVSLVFSSVPFAVMMATPTELEDFAFGFSLTEGVIGRADDIRGVSVEQEERGWRLEINLAPQRLHVHLARRRVLSGRTGCGICGIEDLDALPAAAAPAGPAPEVEVTAIRRALLALEEGQELNRATRAVHAAAFAAPDGTILHLREDVGRHNALDKLVGALLRRATPPAAGFVLVTSRCSFEMVEKAAAIGARTIVAISAPTSLALDRARALDMTLVAVARRDSITVFHGAERVRGEVLPA